VSCKADFDILNSCLRINKNYKSAHVDQNEEVDWLLSLGKEVELL
jgi:hypothetical protein